MRGFAGIRPHIYKNVAFSAIKRIFLCLTLSCHPDMLSFVCPQYWAVGICQHEQRSSTARNLKRKDFLQWSLELLRRQQTGDCLSGETATFVWVSISKRYLFCTGFYQLWTRECTFIPRKSLRGLCQSPSLFFSTLYLRLKIKQLKDTKWV